MDEKDVIGALPPDWKQPVVDTLRTQEALGKVLKEVIRKEQQNVQFQAASALARRYGVENMLMEQLGLTRDEANYCEAIMIEHTENIGTGMSAGNFRNILSRERNEHANSDEPDVKELVPLIDSVLEKMNRKLEGE